MDTVKILHCADLHIGAAQKTALGAKAQTRRAEALITFENIVKLAKENSVDFLLIAGDLFSSNDIEESMVERVLECIADAPEVKVIFAAGNHDPINSQSPFFARKNPDNFYILPACDAELSFPELKTKIYGRSFCEVYLQGENRFSLHADENTINIMCQHGEVGSDLSSNYNSITPEFIDNCGMDYIALGHVHKRSEIAKRGNTYFAYCGCAEGLGFDELGEKGVYLGEVGKGLADLRFVKTCVRTNEKVSVDVGDCENSPAAAEKVLAFIKDKFGASFKDNLYKVILKGNVPDGRWFDTAEITSRLSNEVYFAKVKDETKVLHDLEVLRHENSLKGMFVSKMLSLIEEKPEEADALSLALNIGLKAFCAEVSYNED